jgi:UrcA family protein
MKSICTALLVFATTIGGSAFAADRADRTTETIAVQTADLNLTSPEGGVTLQRRLSQAVNQVCPRPTMVPDLRAMRAWKACTQQARAATATQVSRVKANAMAATASARTAPTAVLAQ